MAEFSFHQFGRMQLLQNVFTKTPFLRWDKVPTENTEHGDSGKYDTRLIEI